jgi:glucose-6-phosphate dehydrogenase assembly protein OpcA
MRNPANAERNGVSELSSCPTLVGLYGEESNPRISDSIVGHAKGREKHLLDHDPRLASPDPVLQLGLRIIPGGVLSIRTLLVASGYVNRRGASPVFASLSSRIAALVLPEP